MTKKFDNIRQYELFCLSILTAVAVTGTFIYTKPVLLPFVFAVFGYFASLPLMNILEKRLKLASYLSFAVTLLLTMSVFTFVVIQVLISITDLINEAGRYEESFINLVGLANKYLASFNYTLDRESIQQFLNSLPISSYVRQVASDSFGFIANAFLVSVIYLFLMIGRTQREMEQRSILAEIEKKVSSYVLNKILLSLGTAILIFIILSIFQVPMAFLFSAFAFLLNFIPTIGSLFATALPLPIIILEHGFALKFWLVLALTSAVQLAIGNFIDPKIIGKELDLHPIVIILSLIFWGLIWGTAGVFVAVPMTATLKIILARLEITRGFSEVLAGRL